MLSCSTVLARDRKCGVLMSEYQCQQKCSAALEHCLFYILFFFLFMCECCSACWSSHSARKIGNRKKFSITCDLSANVHLRKSHCFCTFSVFHTLFLHDFFFLSVRMPKQSTYTNFFSLNHTEKSLRLLWFIFRISFSKRASK